MLAPQSILVWINIGAIAGWLTGILVKGNGFGLVGNIFVGILEAGLAALLAPRLGLYRDHSRKHRCRTVGYAEPPLHRRARPTCVKGGEDMRRTAARIGLLVSLFFGLCQPVSASPNNAAATPAPKGHYFLIVWTYQGPDDDVVHAHTFTSFYRGDDLAAGAIRPTTISWLPASGIVHLLGTERGHNFSLDQTLKMACVAGRKVKAWGPYEIKPELYRSAMRRVETLASGRIRYSMISSPPTSMNCITAAGDLTPAPLHTGILWGVAAGAEVVRHLSPYFVGGTNSILKSLPTTSIAKACPGQLGRTANSDNDVAVP